MPLLLSKLTTNYMKTMTCSQLGGPCEEKISGNTPKELIKNAILHMEKNHPLLVAKLKADDKSDKYNSITTVEPDDDHMKNWGPA